MNLVDTHCHLDYIEREGGDLEAIMAACKEAGVQWMINPSVSPDRFEDVMRVTERFSNVYAAVAVHPTDVQDCSPLPGGEGWVRGQIEGEQYEWLSKIQTMLSHPKVVAIGETGLDYYHSTEHVD